MNLKNYTSACKYTIYLLSIERSKMFTEEDNEFGSEYYDIYNVVTVCAHIITPYTLVFT